MKICIVGGGNAAHTLAALFPYKGHETYVFASYADEAERLKKGCDEQGGIIANFAAENTPSGEVKGTPKVISKDAADVVPQADVLILPLPSFAYSPVLKSLKPHLRQGQFIGVTPGQGGFDWVAREELGELAKSITFFAVMPMPFK